MTKLKSWFKKATCKHDHAELIRWHWTHGINGNDPEFIEAEYRCLKCGKTFYRYSKEIDRK